MNIQEFRLANCKLYRTPPLRTDEVEDLIGDVLLQAWKNGTSARGAISQIVKDQGIVNKLGGQISKNMDFQRQAGLRKVEAQTNMRRSMYADAQKQRLAQIESTYGHKADETETELQQVQGTYQEKQRVYNAAQAKLDELRSSVQSNLDDLGGDEGIQTLLDINQTIVGDQSKKKTRAKGSYVPKKKSGDAGEPGDDTGDQLQDSGLEIVMDDDTAAFLEGEPVPSSGYKKWWHDFTNKPIIKPIYKALTYEVFKFPWEKK